MLAGGFRVLCIQPVPGMLEPTDKHLSSELKPSSEGGLLDVTFPNASWWRRI